MQLNLMEATAVKQKLQDEVNWLTVQVAKAPEGVKAEIQTILDNRTISLEAIKVEIANVVVTVPEEVEATAQQYITAQVEGPVIETV